MNVEFHERTTVLELSFLAGDFGSFNRLRRGVRSSVSQSPKSLIQLHASRVHSRVFKGMDRAFATNSRGLSAGRITTDWSGTQKKTTSPDPVSVLSMNDVDA